MLCMSEELVKNVDSFYLIVVMDLSVVIIWEIVDLI